MNVLGEKLEKNHHNPYHVFFPQNIFPSHKICIAKKIPRRVQNGKDSFFAKTQRADRTWVEFNDIPGQTHLRVAK